MRNAIRQAMTRATAATLGLALAIGMTAPAYAGPHMLVDIRSGKVIEHEDAFQKWYPASLTKLMTAYVAFRQVKSGKWTMQTPIVMTKRAAAEPPSKLGLKPGQALTLDDALKVLLVKSANDVAYAIAENLGGTMPNYVAMMNAEARRLGMNSTNFINPHGLPGGGQYTTARDLAVLVLAIKREFPQYSGYFSLEGVQVGKRKFGNYNKLIARFDGADGMKTGYICASGYNQVSTATRNGKAVISVVLGSDSLAGRTVLSADLLQKGLTEGTGFGDPTVYKLKPYGAARDQVSDISEMMCRKRGKKKKVVRSESTDEVGDKKTSPWVHQLTRPLAMAQITIIPAGKDSAAAEADAAVEEVADAGLLVVNGRKVSVPVPQPRPVN
ncbi:D-alanyl-D-alanine carboxypeptidase family protein [Rhizobium sp. LjRoot254]|uniref:D-alanyl-D-alanine carboxypeptidase family protein n=1 Tax=Rhizobium sp. LjRoot254 TaxID=3342297 RepID=UPI003F4FD6F0